MTDWSQRSQTFQGHDMSWLGSAFGVDMGIPAELDIALFDTVTAFPNGFLPPGIVLARRASDNVLGHYDPGTTEVNEVQTVTITGTPTGGGFTLTFRGATTASIAFNATAAQVQAALEAISTVQTGDVVVGGGPAPGTPFTVEFRGQYQDEDVPQMTTANTFTGGAAPASAVTTTTAGGGAGAATGGSGLEIAVGHLLFPVSTLDSFTKQRTTGPATCSLFTRGRVRVFNLPANHGLDAAARAELRHIEYLDIN